MYYIAWQSITNTPKSSLNALFTNLIFLNKIQIFSQTDLLFIVKENAINLLSTQNDFIYRNQAN